MENYIKQQVFTKENIGLYYLSPYVKIKEQADGVYVSRFDRQNGFLFEEKKITNVLLSAKDGISEKKLEKLIKEELSDEAEDVLLLCIQEGLIE